MFVCCSLSAAVGCPLCVVCSVLFLFAVSCVLFVVRRLLLLVVCLLFVVCVLCCVV